MGPGPDDFLVVEGSRNTGPAGKEAGMRRVASANVNTEQEDLCPTDTIVTCPSDPGGEKAVLSSGPAGVVRDGLVYVEPLLRNFEA